MTGGVPLFYQGQCGVGVSGIADGDEVVAKAGAEALSYEVQKGQSIMNEG